jgi:hypothetical protein
MRRLVIFATKRDDPTSKLSGGMFRGSTGIMGTTVTPENLRS